MSNTYFDSETVKKHIDLLTEVFCCGFTECETRAVLDAVPRHLLTMCPDGAVSRGMLALAWSRALNEVDPYHPSSGGIKPGMN